MSNLRIVSFFIASLLTAVPATAGDTVQEAYLKASNTGPGDFFGYSVAISGDTAVIGSRDEASSATTIDGDQVNDDSPKAGAAYVFVRKAGVWTQQAYLKPSNTDAGDEFGWDVAISGDTIVVGAIFQDGSTVGANGDPSGTGAFSIGAVYVFVRSGESWSQQAFLKIENADLTDYFGRAVAVSGDTLVVGVRDEDSGAAGVNGDPSDNSKPNSGAAYVFTRHGTTWSQEAYLKADAPRQEDHFGHSVSVSGDTVVIGAPEEDSAVTGVNGSGVGVLGNSGAAYVFAREGTLWRQEAYVKASNTGMFDAFGESVSVSGDTLVVGASGEDSIATGVNGDQANDGLKGAGAAYVLVRNGSTWTQQAYLKASSVDDGEFGSVVGVSGDTVVVGAGLNGANSAGVNGHEGGGPGSSATGAAYLFVRSGSSWSQHAFLKASNPDKLDFFSSLSVAVSGNTALVGSYQEDSAATGVDGDQSDDSSLQSGAMYVFAVNAFLDPWNDLGEGLAGASGIPQLGGTGSLIAGEPVSLSLTSAAPAALTVLFASTVSAPLPFKGGTLVPVPVLYAPSFVTSASGTVLNSLAAWPAGISGLSLYFQHVIQDAAATQGLSLSNALRADVP